MYVGIARSFTAEALDGQVPLDFPLVNGKPSSIASFRISGVDKEQKTNPKALTAWVKNIQTNLWNLLFFPANISLQAISLSMRPINISLSNARVYFSGLLLCLILGFLFPSNTFAQEYTPLVFINAGGAALDGTWENDEEGTPSIYLQSGTANIETIRNTPTTDGSVPADVPLAIFETMRIDANQPEPFMRWSMNQAPYAEFLVQLHFIEMSRCSVGNRVFDVEINDVLVLDDLDCLCRGRQPV